MEEQAKRLLKKAILEGARPCILHGHVAFRPVPSVPLSIELMELCRNRQKEAVMLKLIRGMQTAAEGGE